MEQELTYIVSTIPRLFNFIQPVIFNLMIKMNKSQSLLPTTALVYCAVIWGSTFIVAKEAIKSIDPMALVAWRFMLSAVGMALYILVQNRFKLAAFTKLFRDFIPGIYLGILLGILYIAQTVGLLYTTASNSGFITGLFVVFVPLLGWLFLRQKLTNRQYIALLLALIGLWFLTSGVQGANRGDYLTLLCAITYALHVLYAGRLMARGVDPYILNFQQILVTGLFALIAVGLYKRSLEPSTPHVLWIVLFLTIFPTLIAFMFQLWAQKQISSTRTALIFTLEPVFAAIFAWTLGGETVQPLNALGGALMIGAMIISETGYRDKLSGITPTR